MKDKLSGGFLAAYYLLTLIAVVAFFAVMMTFTETKWGWPWWVNIFAIPVFWFILNIPFAEMIIVLSVLIYTVTQLFSSYHGKMFPVCAFFTVVCVARLALGFIAGILHSDR